MKGLTATLAVSVAQAEHAVRDELQAEGFGVLSEIDVAATLQAKLGITRRALKILGACNPSLAHRALELDPTLALVLPCNVALEELADGETLVSIADPRQLLDSEAGAAELHALGEEAAAKLERVIERLGG
jgi:uncharacterized protein (DUF302 family)